MSHGKVRQLNEVPSPKLRLHELTIRQLLGIKEQILHRFKFSTRTRLSCRWWMGMISEACRRYFLVPKAHYPTTSATTAQWQMVVPIHTSTRASIAQRKDLSIPVANACGKTPLMVPGGHHDVAGMIKHDRGGRNVYAGRDIEYAAPRCYVVGYKISRFRKFFVVSVFLVRVWHENYRWISQNVNFAWHWRAW